MADTWECPAKVNLSLRVGARGADGYHPLSSLVQTIDWLDLLDVEEADADGLEIEGADLPEGGENLVWRAVDALGRPRPPLHLRLVKRIAVAAGLGGGSADAAATLAACGRLLRLPADALAAAAARVGSDVPFLLTGGSAVTEGRGERILPRPALAGFALAVVVPAGELRTPDVYRRWDELGGPAGPPVRGRSLPPALRSEELVNDLTPAAIDLVPALADHVRDLERAWGRPVAMSGSGPSLFAFFADGEEAAAAAAEAPGDNRAAVGAGLRPRGVARVDR